MEQYNEAFGEEFDSCFPYMYNLVYTEYIHVKMNFSQIVLFAISYGFIKRCFPYHKTLVVMGLLIDTCVT